MAKSPAVVTAFRFFSKDGSKLVSQADRSCVWPAPAQRVKKPGAWLEITGDLRLCGIGFHACETVYESLSNRCGHVFAKVEARGTILKGDDKFCASEMRIRTLYSLRAVVGLACIGAAMTLANFEKKYPTDMRPRTALELALRYVAGGVVAGLKASASASEAAWAAAEAAWAASASAASASAASAAAEAAWAASASASAASAAEAAWAASASASAASASASAAAKRSHIDNFNRHALDFLETVERKGEAFAVEQITFLIPTKRGLVRA